MTNRSLRMARAALLAVVAVACSPDRILQVEDIDVALPPAVQGVEALPSLLAGVIGDFGPACNGGVPSTGLAMALHQLTLPALLSRELIHSDTFPTRIAVARRP